METSGHSDRARGPRSFDRSSWLMVETLTIGQLKSAYRNLRLRADRTAVARSIGLTARVLESWMPAYARVRNIYAHHGRLWNVGVGVCPAIRHRPLSHGWRAIALCPRGRGSVCTGARVAAAVLNRVSPRSGWARRLHELLSTRPRMNLDGMGVVVVILTRFSLPGWFIAPVDGERVGIFRPRPPGLDGARAPVALPGTCSRL
jgi:hypothetical protein